eukprot:SAG11_NODE_180_length_13278_cov_9.158434_9_plen_69_part_00
MQANPLLVLRSRKTYSKYLKKTRPSEIPPVFLLTQYVFYKIVDLNLGRFLHWLQLYLLVGSRRPVATC